MDAEDRGVSFEPENTACPERAARCIIPDTRVLRPLSDAPPEGVQCTHEEGLMRTRIVRIGNSRGLRIPKPLLEQTGISDHVEIEVEGDRLVIRRAGHPREGWEEAFRKMACQRDDELLDGDLPSLTHWDDEEWQWP
jgi:antitoxin MazE